MEPFNFDNSNWQNLILLALLALILIGNIASRHNSLIAKFFKLVGVVAGLAMICSLLYFYRFEIRDVKERVFGVTDYASARVAKNGRITINSAPDGEFYVEAKVDGESVKFLFDETLSDIVLNHADAKKIGVNFDDLTLNKSYQDSGKVMWGAGVKVYEMVIDDLKISDLDVVVSESDADFSRLGMSFLKLFSSYKFSEKQLFLKDLLDAPGQITLNAGVNGHFYLNVIMNGKKVYCMIDTGASNIVLDQSHATPLGFDVSQLNFSVETQTANGTSMSANITLDELSIGGIRFSKVPAILNRGDLGGTCLLGMDFLHKFKKYDFSKSKLILTL